MQIARALPVADWVQEAAHQFNAEEHTLEGRPIQVTVTPMDGLTAKGRYERDEMDPLPTAWIPDSRYLVELVNAAYKERLGPRRLSHRRGVPRPAAGHLAADLGHL